MAENDNFLINRSSLAKFLPDNDTIRRFEKLFQSVNVTIPINLEIIFSRLDELLEASGNSDMRAGLANDLIAAIRKDIDLLISAPMPDVSRLPVIDRLSHDLDVAVGNVDTKANRLADFLTAVVRQFEVDPDSLRAAINRVSDSIASLGRNIEADVTRPAFVMSRSFPVDYLDFDQAPAYVAQTARAAWNPTDDTLNIHHSGDVTQQVGLESYARITNNAGFTIQNGQAVGFDPVTDSFVLFLANGTQPAITIIGIATQQILNGAQGRITNWGRVRDLDTTGTPVGEVWGAGDILYTSTTIAGALTNVKPTAPNVSLPIAQVRVVSSTVGQIFVRPTIEQQLYYGQFDKTTDQVPSAANTANAITWTSALIASGISIGAPTSRIVVANAGLYNFSASFQLTSGSASVKNVWIWYRKNGVDITNSALVTSMDSGTAIRVPSRTFLISLVAGDYVELMWAADDVNVTLDAIPATAFAPAAPAALLSVNQEQQ